METNDNRTPEQSIEAKELKIAKNWVYYYVMCKRITKFALLDAIISIIFLIFEMFIFATVGLAIFVLLLVIANIYMNKAAEKLFG